jgi:hypothetical protein
MSSKDDKLQAISDEMNEHILAVKGTLELLDASVSEDDLHSLLLKAMERMDTVQKLSHEMLALLQKCLYELENPKR